MQIVEAATSLAALCEFENTTTGATLYGEKIRYDEATGLLSVKDFIMIIEVITSNAAKLRIPRLKEEKHIVVSEDASTGFKIFKDENNHMILGARLIALAKLCGRLKGDRAEKIKEHFADTTLRFEAGDQSMVPQLHENEERTNRAAAEGNGLAIELQKFQNVRWKKNFSVEQAAAQGYDLAWANDQNQSRALEKVSNKNVIQACRQNLVFSPSIQNILNYAVMGNTCSTGEFKKQNGIPAHVPMQGVMTRDQLNLRKMLEDHLADEFAQREFENSKAAERFAREKATKMYNTHSEFNQTGLKVVEGMPHRAAMSLAIEAKDKKVSRLEVQKEHDRLAQQSWTATANVTSVPQIR